MKSDLPLGPRTLLVKVSRDYVKAQLLTGGDPRDKARHIAVKRFFRAHYQKSFPVSRLRAAVNAIEGVDINFPDIQQTATDLVRAGVLRAKVFKGHRHYELDL